MELTKKDLRHIRDSAIEDVWSVTDHASEYAHLYRITYLKEVVRRLQEKIKLLEEQYNQSHGNKQ